MMVDRTAALESQPGVLPPGHDLGTFLAEGRRARARADAEATKRLTARLRSDPSTDGLQNDLEDTLVEVAAHVVQAMVRLREQRQAGAVEPELVVDSMAKAANALRSAELTSAVMRSVVPTPRGEDVVSRDRAS